MAETESAAYSIICAYYNNYVNNNTGWYSVEDWVRQQENSDALKYHYFKDIKIGDNYNTNDILMLEAASIARFLILCDSVVGTKLIETDEYIVSGIKSAAASVASAAKSVVQGAINAAKSALKINSPSKVFIAIGKSTNEGFVKGIEADANKSAAAAEGLAYSVIDSMQSSIARISNAINADIDMHPTIRPVLDLSNV